MSVRDEQDCVELLKGMGELYRRGGQSQRALVMLLIAVQLAPTDPALLRSRALWSGARKDEARQCFKRYLTARRAAQ